MTGEDTVTLAREEYDALIERIAELEDRLAAVDADDGARVPHEVARAIIGGEKPAVAFRKHRGFTLQELSERAGLAVGYLSEIERGVKPGSASALVRMASALGTTIDVLVGEAPKRRPYRQVSHVDVKGGQDE